MKHNCSLLGAALVVAVVFTPGATTKASGASAASIPELRVQVDPRVELMSVIFHLAGNPEYNQGKIRTYEADIEKQFGAFREHEVVKVVRQVRRVRGVSYDAPMSLAVHLNNAVELALLVPLDPWPETLDRRWTRPDTTRFLEAARQFVKDSGFLNFIEQHRPLYSTVEARLLALMRKEGHLEWFEEFYGDRRKATFTIFPGLLNGGCCYGVRCKETDGENLYCILGIWNVPSDGLPEFTSGTMQTVVHEFGHSFANPVVERHFTDLRKAGETLFGPVAAKMRAQAYADAHTLLCESLVRACEVRYGIRYNGPAAGPGLAAYQKGRGFVWTKELSDLLGEYEAQREKYPTLESFVPKLIAFFNEYAKDFAERQRSLATKRPKVVSMTPVNGDGDVDPSLTSFKVVFDRPMRDGSWSLVGEPSECPEGTGPPRYDQSRKTWSVAVKLAPNRTYRFSLNSDELENFVSEEGVPLEPVSVSFSTRK